MSEVTIGSKTVDNFRAGFAEFFATLLLVFFGVGSICGVKATTNGVESHQSNAVNDALSFGFVKIINGFAIAGISGCHINPAVSLTLVLSGNISATRFFVFLFAQVAGAMCGGGLLRLMVGGGGDTQNTTNLYDSGLKLHDDITPAQGLFIEMMGTLLVIYAVFFVGVTAGNIQNRSGATLNDVVNAVAPIPIGFAVAAAHLFANPFTGSGINPARALGAAVWEDGAFWDSRTGRYFWIYIIGPILAAVIAPLIQWIQHGFIRPGDIHDDHQQYHRPFADARGGATKSALVKNTASQGITSPRIHNQSFTNNALNNWETNSLPSTQPTIYRRPFTRPDSVSHVSVGTLQTQPESRM